MSECAIITGLDYFNAQCNAVIDPADTACPCCGAADALESGAGVFDICGECFWEDCPVQRAYPDCSLGPNHGWSLREAREFLSLGNTRAELKRLFCLGGLEEIGLAGR